MFESDRSGNGDLYSITLAGHGLRRLTSNPGRDMSPAWSPDGQRIAFVSTMSGRPEIYVMGANGSSVQPITSSSDPVSHPAWSPDGTHIVFVRRETLRAFEMVSVAADGSGAVTLTTGDAVNTQPDWG